ncbi:MAG TPA: fructose-bisphosphatase class II, partial [Clostridiales bacterium]|nr:fructose-bisphosphatase class II [Clostridiales bacterium]
RLYPLNETQIARAKEMGIADINAVLTHHDLVQGDDIIFAATGITDGDLLRGVRYLGDRATTDSLVMRAKTGTVRRIQATHRYDLKPLIRELISRQQ